MIRIVHQEDAESAEEARERLRKRLLEETIARINKEVDSFKITLIPADKMTAPKSCFGTYPERWSFT